MGADEEGTIERAKALRRELVDPKIAEHKRRIVKTPGDGLLVEFASVADAVPCADEVQQTMPERDTDNAAGSRIALRQHRIARRAEWGWAAANRVRMVLLRGWARNR